MPSFRSLLRTLAFDFAGLGGSSGELAGTTVATTVSDNCGRSDELVQAILDWLRGLGTERPCRPRGARR